jgi:uncharacterized membrane protein
MVISDTCASSNVRRLVIRPNCSSTWRQSLVFLTAVAVPLGVVAVVLAWRGFWLVLPFAGLEVGALFASLYVVARATRRCQVVSIGPATVVVEKGRDSGHGAAQRGPEQRVTFERGWVRIELASPVTRRDASRLWIAAPGRRVEIGEFLVEAEREMLARELRRLLALPSHAAGVWTGP